MSRSTRSLRITSEPSKSWPTTSATTARRLEEQPVLLSDLLHGAARKFPDKEAVIFPNDRISFGELDKKSNQVAARLARIGIGRGDRVALIYENSLAALIYFWGILKSGAETVDLP